MLVYREDEELITSNINLIDDVWYDDSNVVKSINEEVNSIIQSIQINKDKSNEDHVVPRRSFFQMVLQRTKSPFTNKNLFYPVQINILFIQYKTKLFNLERRIIIKFTSMEKIIQLEC